MATQTPTVRVLNAVLPTSTGTETYTVDNLGDADGVLAMLSWGIGDGGDSDGRMAMGVCDGSQGRSCAMLMRDNLGTSDTYRLNGSGSGTSSPILRAFKDNGTVGLEITFSQWVTDGIEVSVDTLDSTFNTATLTLVFFAQTSGADVGDVTTSSSIGGTAAVSGLTDSPNVVFFISCGHSFGTTSVTSQARLSYGIAINHSVDGIKQRYWSYHNKDAQSTTQIVSVKGDDRVAVTSVASASSGSTFAEAELTSFDASGFTLTTRNKAASLNVAYLALFLEDADIDLLDATLSDTASTFEIDAGFDPQAVLGFHNLVTASYGTYAFGDAGASATFPACSKPFVEMCQTFVGNDGAGARTNEAAWNWSDKFLDVQFPILSPVIGELAQDSLNWITDGVEFDIDTNPDSAADGWYLCIGGGEAFVLMPDGVASAEAVGTPTVVAGAAPTIEPTGVASAEAVGTPALLQEQFVSPTGIASSEAIGSPVLATSIAVQPGSVASAEAVGTPEVVVGTVTLEVTGIASAEAIGGAVVVAGVAPTIEPTGIASAEAVGSPTIAPGAAPTIQVGGIASAEAVGIPELTGLVLVQPTGIASAEAIGTPELLQAAFVQPTGVASAEAIGTPAIVLADVVLEPTGISSAEAIGTPLVVSGASVIPAGIASAEAVGTPELVAAGTTLVVTGIPSAEAVGAPELVAGAVTVVAGNVPSAEAVGTPAIVAAVTVLPSGVPSAEAIGTPALSQAQVVQPTGIPSEEAVGTPFLAGDVLTIAGIVGIPSAEAVGIPFVLGGAIPVTYRKAITDSLTQAAKLGTFVIATYDDDDTLQQGLQEPPGSIEANEISSRFASDERHGRKLRDERRDWRFELRLRFRREVILDPFEQGLLDTPLVVERDAAEDRPQQVILRLVDADPTHPPRNGRSNGTKVTYTFRAELCPA